MKLFDEKFGARPLARELLDLGDEGTGVALVEPARHVTHALGGLLREVARDALLLAVAGHAGELLAQGPQAFGHPGLLLCALVEQLAAGLLPQLLGLLARSPSTGYDLAKLGREQSLRGGHVLREELDAIAAAGLSAASPLLADTATPSGCSA